MPMHDVATGIAFGTRDLAMEVLCTLPICGERKLRNGRRQWSAGAVLVEMAIDFAVPMDAIRVVLSELAKTYAVVIGNIAPVYTRKGVIRGGRGAFVEPHNWPRVQAACEAYLADYPDYEE